MITICSRACRQQGRASGASYVTKLRTGTPITTEATTRTSSSSPSLSWSDIGDVLRRVRDSSEALL